MEEILFDSEDFKNNEKFSQFMRDNSGDGTLKLQAYTANQAFPLEDVSISISKVIDGEKVIFFTGKTDASGIIDDIHLPAAPAKDEVNKKEDIVYTNYDIVAICPTGRIRKEYEVAIFDNIKVIQPIRIPITTLIEGEENKRDD